MKCHANGSVTLEITKDFLFSRSGTAAVFFANKALLTLLLHRVVVTCQASTIQIS